MIGFMFSCLVVYFFCVYIVPLMLIALGIGTVVAATGAAKVILAADKVVMKADPNFGKSMFSNKTLANFINNG